MQTYDDYSYSAEWSDEDQVFIASVAEFPSIHTHGDTPEEAIQEAKYVIEDILEDMPIYGEQPPEPRSK